MPQPAQIKVGFKRGILICGLVFLGVNAAFSRNGGQGEGVSNHTMTTPVAGVSSQPRKKKEAAKVPPSQTVTPTSEPHAVPPAPSQESKLNNSGRVATALIPKEPGKAVLGTPIESPVASVREELPVTKVVSAQSNRPFGAPQDLLAKLRIAGLSQVTSWRASNLDSTWWGAARVHMGNNEVSCLIESTQAGSVEHLTLEAEFYDCSVATQPVVMQFVRAIAAFRSDIPAGLAEAIANERSWTEGRWSFLKDRHPSGRGYDLRLEFK